MCETFKTLKQSWRYLMHAQNDLDFKERLFLLRKVAVGFVDEINKKLSEMSKEESNV